MNELLWRGSDWKVAETPLVESETDKWNWTNKQINNILSLDATDEMKVEEIFLH